MSVATSWATRWALVVLQGRKAVGIPESVDLDDTDLDVVRLAEQVPVVGVFSGAVLSLGRGSRAGLVPDAPPGGPFFMASTQKAWSAPSR